MNIKCKVCGKKASGYHFGVFSCQGCKVNVNRSPIDLILINKCYAQSFFGRMHDRKKLSECKIGAGRCILDPKTRNWCKACRLRKCRTAGMSKSGSRHGRRSNWFKAQHLINSSGHQVQLENINDPSPPPSHHQDSLSSRTASLKCRIRLKLLSRINLRETIVSGESPLDLSQKQKNPAGL